MANRKHEPASGDSTPVLATRMMTALEREHELSKMAKEIAVGLPIREDSARAIAARIGTHPLAMAAFGSWIEALQEAIEDSVASVAFGVGHGNSEAIVMHMLRERLDELTRQAGEISSRLTHGDQPPERKLMGATAIDRTGRFAQSKESQHRPESEVP